MDYSVTRHENDVRLLGRLDAIHTGKDRGCLVPFAKAYLGMLYDVDSDLEPTERVGLLANAELAEAILAGFEASLQQITLPTPADIGEALHREQEQSIGYIVLAGMDLMSARSESISGIFETLPDPTLKSALCFHFTHVTCHSDTWVSAFFEKRPELAQQALIEFWEALLALQSSYLPGLLRLMRDPAQARFLGALVPRLLRAWPTCRARELQTLLQIGIRHADPAELLQAAQFVLGDANRLNARQHVYWLSSAFLLSPEINGSTLAAYAGVEKIKILPLLDFCVSALGYQGEAGIALPAKAYAQLLRIVAPKFSPQLDRYGNLSEISLKVLWLFHALATHPDTEAQAALRWLRQARVMRVYRDVLAAVDEVQAQYREDHSLVPSVEAFIDGLQRQDRLRGRRNRFDRN